MRPGSGSRSEIAFAWLCVVVWIAAVQTFAGGVFSANETARFFEPLMLWFNPDADAESIAAMHFAIRKTAHFGIYAILALLALRAFRVSFDRPLAWLAATSLALAIVVAVVDESRQTFAPERTGALSDVALDIGGAVSALALTLWRLGNARAGRLGSARK